MAVRNNLKTRLALTVVLAGTIGTLFAQEPKNEFAVKGTISGKQQGWMYLYYPDKNNKRVKDSAKIVNGRFSFRGKVAEPAMAFLSLKGADRSEGNSTNFFLEPGRINISLEPNHFGEAKITGSKTQAEYAALEKTKTGIRKEMAPLSEAYSKESAAYMAAVKSKKDDRLLDSMKLVAAELHTRFEPFNARMDQKDYAFFEKHPSSYVTAYMMRFHVNELPLDSLQLFYDRMNQQVKQSNMGKDLEQEIAKLRSGSPGSTAKDFATTDINGQPLRLSNFKGKYVLVDFWASWCVPCRKGNPHLKELYAKYKDKGIEFIGVSDDDRNHEAWKKAVEKDGLPWRHVLRGLKYENGVYDRSTDISESFGIHTLPTKILIDPKGMIIGRYGEEEKALDAKLAGIFE